MSMIVELILSSVWTLCSEKYIHLNIMNTQREAIAAELNVFDHFVGFALKGLTFPKVL